MDKYIKTVSNECIDTVNTLMNDNTIYLSKLLEIYLQHKFPSFSDKLDIEISYSSPILYDIDSYDNIINLPSNKNEVSIKLSVKNILVDAQFIVFFQYMKSKLLKDINLNKESINISDDTKCMIINFKSDNYDYDRFIRYIIKSTKDNVK